MANVLLRATALVVAALALALVYLRMPETGARGEGGLCERCNYLKESPGWTSWVADPGHTNRHKVHGVTEHLRILRSTSPPMPGGPAGSVDYSPAEQQLASNYTLIS